MQDEGVMYIVVSGTCAVYGSPETKPNIEDTPPNPINPYGASKLFMERMLADYEMLTTSNGCHFATSTPQDVIRAENPVNGTNWKPN